MIREIVTDEEFLSKPCEPATADDAGVAQDLLDTMESIGDDCACLAANQIGVSKRIIAYEYEGKYYVMFNPVIEKAGIPFTATESCLSLKRETEVKRFRRVTVAYEVIKNGELDKRKRKIQDWNAEVVQHAIDHCDGILV